MEDFTREQAAAVKGEISRRMTFHTDEHGNPVYCDKHTRIIGGEEKPYPVQLMELRDGSVKCPMCEREQRNKEIEHETEEWRRRMDQKVLSMYSLIADPTLKEATFSTFQSYNHEDERNKRRMMELVNQVKAGAVMNIFLTGESNAGKSHLAMSAIKELNKRDAEGYAKSALFVNSDALMRRIKNSFKDSSEKLTEAFAIELLTRVDYLVIDDLGAEVGDTDNENRAANDFIHRVWYGVSTGRQGKFTIVTTNLSGVALTKLYDKKVVSRLTAHLETVKFEEKQKERKGRTAPALSF
ncbi:ATP-binding protein [Bacillus siamensis]|uniref:ATP-binding protein n=2 Tax=Bacillus amyloliquefaciens group TaxID=1938374 RepID=UPI002E1FC764|nr:ATP-binding protein [Bacillus siamensis]MED5050147.1 ATP-binding protein [Bacillus siamensis]